MSWIESCLQQVFNAMVPLSKALKRSVCSCTGRLPGVNVCLCEYDDHGIFVKERVVNCALYFARLVDFLE